MYFDKNNFIKILLNKFNNFIYSDFKELLS
jgi:hypothetical protein